MIIYRRLTAQASTPRSREPAVAEEAQQRSLSAEPIGAAEATVRVNERVWATTTGLATQRSPSDSVSRATRRARCDQLDFFLKYLRFEGEHRSAGLPRVTRKSGPLTSLHQKRMRVPTPFHSHLRQEQATVHAVDDDQPVPANLHPPWVEAQLKRAEHRNLEGHAPACRHSTAVGLTSAWASSASAVADSGALTFAATDRRATRSNC